VPKSKPSTIKLQVFKGREAKLNKAIFHTLALKGPQTIYDIHKEAKAQRGLRDIRYASVNKRIRPLEESGYVRKVGAKRTKAGFEASVYELQVKAYLSMLLDTIDIESLISQSDEGTLLTILASLVDARL